MTVKREKDENAVNIPVPAFVSLTLGLPAAWGQDELIQKGKKVFECTCTECHRLNGKGLPGTYPALDGNSLSPGSR